MATYKVIQDVEAEDKLVGPLTLRQFIYAAVAAFLLYMSFFSLTKNVAFLMIFFLPPALLLGFLAIPWHGDQPTEIWAIARIRFLLKPRKRIWDQSGSKELVSITAPKQVERNYTDGLTQTEVNSRLRALASTIDSRGWAVKNTNVNLNAGLTAGYTDSDRLVDASILPQEVSSIDIRADDDMLDPAANPVAQHFDSMMQNAAASHRQQLIAQLQQPGTQQTTISTQPPNQQPQNTNGAPQQAPNDYWFMHQATPVAGQATFADSTVVTPGTAAANEPNQIPHAATPTADEEALVAKLKAANATQDVQNDHMKYIKTPEELAEDARAQAAAAAQAKAEAQAAAATKAQVTSDKQAAIINLASNDDLDVATIARQAHKQNEGDDGEVVISLH